MTDVLALDIASTTGFARGSVADAAPTFGTIAFAKSAGSSQNAIFARAHDWLSAHLRENGKPTMIMFEAMLPGGAMRGETQRHVRDRLAGLHGVLRAAAFQAGVYRIEEASVGDVRAHFIGDRTLKRDAAKREVIRQCRKLGWAVEDDNQGDAAALWSYACGLIEPKTALRVSPLFARGVAL